MNHEENLDTVNSEERLKTILNRVPNSEEFLSELEDFVDDVYPEEDVHVSPARILSYIMPVLLIILGFGFRFYSTYKQTQPVSLEKLIQLHTQNEVTREILIKHMEAKPFGEAIKPIIEIANSGNMHAQNIVCWSYMSGFSVKKNPAIAATFCHKAAAQGHAGAHNNLGVIYDSNDENQDIKKAIHHFRIAAEERSHSAWSLAYIYENYPLPTQNFKEAIHYKTLAADMGNSDAMMSLGDDYFEGRLDLELDYDLALKYYKMAEESGHVDANLWLAIFHLKAPLPYQDYKKMNVYLQKALLRDNHPMAYSMLGDAYRDGLGVEKNIETAIMYYTYGADRGNTYSVFQLANLKDQGDIKMAEVGFKYKNYTLPYAVRNALKYPENSFTKVFDIIHGENTSSLLVSQIFEYYADGTLGKHDHGELGPDMLNMIYFGKGYVDEFQSIVKAYETRASYGSGEHAYQLGMIYMSGGGVIRNPKTSLDWISKAMDNGYPDVQEYVGKYLSMSDEFVQRETKYARDILQKAAILGSEEAAESLGDIYLDGAGVEINKVAAMYWYNHADRGGLNQDETLYSLRKEMSSEELLKAENLTNSCTKSEFISCFN